MLASEDEDMREAAKKIFQFCTDEQVRKMCRDREEYYQDMRNYERAISDRDQTISSYEKVIADRENTISSYKKEISEKDDQIQRLLEENERLKAQE